MSRAKLSGPTLPSIGLYSRSLVFFLALIGVGLLIWQQGFLRADTVPPKTDQTTPEAYDAVLTLTSSGALYAQNSKLGIDTIISNDTYRIRYQVLNNPGNFIDSLSIAVELPKPIDEASLGHRFINNGGAASAESEVVDAQTVVYRASQIGPNSQLVLELEVPKSYLTRTALSALKERLLNWPPIVWTSLSLALPLLTLLILLVVWLARTRRVPLGPTKELSAPPSRLAPALLGILLHGRMTSRELAATLIDLARRGHLIIRQVGRDDFRFSRRSSSDRLEKFEQDLLTQIFGPTGERASSEEISFSLAQELFSQRVSQAFLAAYSRINDLGFFYTNPLRLHRRYQTIGLSLFVLGIVGFFANVFLFEAQRYFLLFWLGMIGSALLITFLSKGLPMRTVYGDRELGRWLAFRNYLTNTEPVGYQAQSQDAFLAYLPYAVVMDVEVEWTKRFYDLPFAQPGWYVAPGVSTIDEFANKIFPLFGYLSHALAISTQPASR